MTGSKTNSTITIEQDLELGEKRLVKLRKKKLPRFFDLNMLFIIIFLVGFGLVMLFSVSGYESARYHDGDTMYYVIHQAEMAAIGAVAMVAAMLIPMKLIKKLSIAIYGAFFLLLLGTFFLGYASNGSTRWIRIAGVSIQPSEFMKVALIIFLAAVLSELPQDVLRSQKHRKKYRNLWFFCLAPIVVIALTNLSTAIIAALIVWMMMFIANKNVKRSFYMVIVGAILGVIGVLIKGGFSGYRSTRIAAWLHPEQYTDEAYQTIQGMYAIGSGGLFGKGLGGSIQKMGYLPEAQNDYIFTIICEELGLFGAICVILLFILLIWRMMVIANNAPDLMGALLVIGVMTHIAVQVILNIAVVTNCIPSTGVTMPFMSYGGSALIVTMAEMGLVMNVGRQITFQPIE